MSRNAKKWSWVAICVLILGGAGVSLGAEYTDINVSADEEHAVRFTSGQTIYVEALREGKWVGRYWSADSRIAMPYDGWAVEAFQVEIDQQPLKSWSWVSSRELAKTERGARHFVVELACTTAPIKLGVHTLVDGTPVLTRWLEITNGSDKAVGLMKLAVWSGELWPGKDFTLGYFTKQEWASEGWLEWKKLAAGVTTVACDKGQGHDDPFFIVRDDRAGEYFIGHLAWSANWKMDFTFTAGTEPLPAAPQFATGPEALKGTLQFGVGPAAAGCQRVLAPGETIATPAVHLGNVSGTLDDAVQGMHEHLRRTVLPTRPKDRSYLMQYLVPADQGYYTPFDEASAFKCADIAAAIGSELFILDAYWWDITCDWVPSAKRFPRGLKPLIDYVHKKGMLFGLYVETEGGRGKIPESKIYKEHPEWFGPANIVKLSIPEAAAWVESENCRMIEEFGLDLFRLDYNPYWTGEGPNTVRSGITENNYWRYYEVFYAMYERIHAKYPKLILQQCAAGGARNDLGTVSRFHEVYLTDGLSIPREMRIYSGATLGLPPENFVILHGADGQPGVGKIQNLDTILRMTYSLSTPQVFVGNVAPSVETLAPERLARFQHYAKLYREFIRPIMPTCKVFHHEPVSARGGVESSGWFAMEFAAPDREQGYALIVRLSATDTDTYTFVPRGLNPAKQYEVRFDRLEATVTLTGASLMREGLPLRLESAGMSELLLFKEK